VAVRRGRCFDTLHTVDGCAAPYKKEGITEGLLLEETTAVMHRCERSGHHLTFASPRSDDQAKNLHFASLVGGAQKIDQTCTLPYTPRVGSNNRHQTRGFSGSKAVFDSPPQERQCRLKRRSVSKGRDSKSASRKDPLSFDTIERSCL
jgi:hypothetical protein